MPAQSDPFMILLGARLTAAVKAAGGSSDVARRAGMPLRTLTKYMSGQTVIPAAALWRLAHVCGLSGEELFGDLDHFKAMLAPKAGLIGRMKRAVSKIGAPSLVAFQLDVPLPRLQAYLSGNAEPPTEFLVRLATAAGEPENWMLTGTARGMVAPPAEQTPETEGLTFVPVLDVKAAAGAGAINDGPTLTETLPFSTARLREMGVSPNKVHGIHARGDSMEPTIADGALVLIDTARTELTQDGVYAIVVDDQARLKRIAPGLDGSITVISDNRDRYPPERISRADLERIRVVGRAVWTERTL